MVVLAVIGVLVFLGMIIYAYEKGKADGRMFYGTAADLIDKHLKGEDDGRH